MLRPVNVRMFLLLPHLIQGMDCEMLGISPLGNKSALGRLIVVFEYYFGELEEESLRDNIVVVRYWAASSINKNKGMVEHLQRYGVIQSKKVAEVMETVDRALFLPDGSSAYEDSPMRIGFNATISAPHMHATCLQLLEKNLQLGMHALDVGSDKYEQNNRSIYYNSKEVRPPN